MKVLITGANGFVARHMIAYLRGLGGPWEITGLGRQVQPRNACDFYYMVDMLDPACLRKVLEYAQPQWIIHLASDSSVGYSWQHPSASFNNNVNIFLNLLECCRAIELNPRILSVGSSEEYGLVKADDLPLREEQPPNPKNPYAVARYSQELLSRVYVEGYRMDIVLTRSFNHFGPGQDTRFAIPSFAQQISRKRANGDDSPLQTGNLEVIRDFLDVRDVVRAYYLLINKGKPGEIYNVCSGTGHSLSQIIDQLNELAGTNYTCQLASHLTRPLDNPVIIGDNTKLKSLGQWQQQYAMRESLSDILAYVAPNS